MQLANGRQVARQQQRHHRVRPRVSQHKPREADNVRAIRHGRPHNEQPQQNFLAKRGERRVKQRLQVSILQSPEHDGPGQQNGHAVVLAKQRSILRRVPA